MGSYGARHSRVSADKHCLMDDDAVRECRSLFEAGTSTREQLSLKYNVRFEYIVAVPNYITRTNVYPVKKTK